MKWTLAVFGCVILTVVFILVFRLKGLLDSLPRSL